MKEFLTEFLSARGRSMLRQLAAVAVFAGVLLAVYDRAYLITGIVAGYLLAGICAWTMIYRTWKASNLGVGKAKMQMWLGMVMRFIMVFILLYAAMQRSGELFLTAAGGFLIAFALYIINLCIFVYRKNME